jgi:hypothetical protein
VSSGLKELEYEGDHTSLPRDEMEMYRALPPCPLYPLGLILSTEKESFG